MPHLDLWGSTELWVLTGLCFLGTLVWRVIGTTVATHIDPEGAMFQWLSCVAYAMLAGLIARILLLPIGILASTRLSIGPSPWWRVLLCFSSCGATSSPPHSLPSP